MLPSFPQDTSTRTSIPSGIAFFDTLSVDLAGKPPPAADACALRVFKRVGVGPGLKPSSPRNDNGVRTALLAAPEAALRLIDRDQARRNAASGRVNNGWLVPPAKIGDYGTSYLFRAVAARIGLGANGPREAEYPTTDADPQGRRLDGRHAYRIRFAPHQLPPVNAFWSLTLYNPAGFMVPNALGRYALGDRTPGLRLGRDGSLTIYVGHRKPDSGTSNWLPAPNGRFRSSTTRLYQPKAAALSGRWKPPGVEHGRSLTADRPSACRRRDTFAALGVATRPAADHGSMIGFKGWISVLSESPGALRSALNESGWVDGEVIAAGGLRQGRAPTTLGLITGHAVVELAKPRRSKELPRQLRARADGRARARLQVRQRRRQPGLGAVHGPRILTGRLRGVAPVVGAPSSTCRTVSCRRTPRSTSPGSSSRFVVAGVDPDTDELLHLLGWRVAPAREQSPKKQRKLENHDELRRAGEAAP